MVTIKAGKGFAIVPPYTEEERRKRHGLTSRGIKAMMLPLKAPVVPERIAETPGSDEPEVAASEED